MTFLLWWVGVGVLVFVMVCVRYQQEKPHDGWLPPAFWASAFLLTLGLWPVVLFDLVRGE